MSLTFSLKYRPQKISQLDIISARTTLSDILKSSHLPHAFLFSGPKGIGKTSAARILAKSLNCEAKSQKLKAKSQIEPCNRCATCQAITRGSHLDIIEIDAASNRGVDDIRSLREAVKLSPSQSRYKVYIIDEAHMLTTEAANALLKTLEEPPEHVIFILATTAPEKLPSTIRSRCQQIKFTKATPEEIIRSLKRIVKGEKLIIKADILSEIAQAADGSLRDAHQLLERLVISHPHPTLAQTKDLLGRQEAAAPDKLVKLLLAKDTLAAINELSRLDQLGIDWPTYTRDLLEALRQKLIASLATAPSASQPLKHLTQLFSRAALEVKRSSIPQLPLELAIVDWSTKDPNDTSPTPTNGHSRPSPTKTSPKSSSPPLSSSQKLAQIEAKWADILKAIRPHNHSIEALLKAARPVAAKDGKLTLEVFYRFHKEQLEQEKSRHIIEEVISQITGEPIRLFYRLGEKPVSAPPVFPAPAKGNGHTSPEASSPSNLDEVGNDAIWRLAQEVFASN